MKTKECIEMPVGLNQWHTRHTCSRQMEVRKGQDNSIYVSAYTNRHRNTCVLFHVQSRKSQRRLVPSAFTTTDVVVLLVLTITDSDI